MCFPIGQKLRRPKGKKVSLKRCSKKQLMSSKRQRSSINTEAGRIGFVGDKQSAYAQLTALLIADGRYAEAFAYVERAKSRALVDLLATQKSINTRSGKLSKSRQLWPSLPKRKMN